MMRSMHQIPRSDWSKTLLNVITSSNLCSLAVKVWHVSLTYFIRSIFIRSVAQHIIFAILSILDVLLNVIRATRNSFMSCRNSTSVHLFAGGVGGTVAAVVTCPLEVVKTRLQASSQVFQPLRVQPTLVSTNVAVVHSAYQGTFVTSRPSGILACMRHIVKTEGLRSLYKGLGPNLIGVAPARAIYFAVYAKTKKALAKGYLNQDSKLIHVCAGASAGFITHSCTAPIWFVKTRLQLDAKTERMNTMKCIRTTYKQYGIRGFYRGLSASYYGISETVIHFVIYEHLKKKLRTHHQRAEMEQGHNYFTDFMIAAGISKTIASIIAYPHEVVRTRLRQEEVDGSRKYKTFIQTLLLIMREEGRKGLYGGLATQLVRQVPNSSILFMTYESMVTLLCSEDENGDSY